MKRRHLVVLTGAGISAESGLQTFRDQGGLWEGYHVYDVATPEAFQRDPALVLNFYNMRRKAVNLAQPNRAHRLLAMLERYLDVTIITQNVDDLHERAGSSRVIHLHGEIGKSQSTRNSSLIYPIMGDELNPGDLCELGSQLRPFIVWFGEQVPMMGPASDEVARADLFAVIGTSLQVYPAAGLLHEVAPDIPVYLIDPGTPSCSNRANLVVIQEKAGSGVGKMLDMLGIALDQT